MGHKKTSGSTRVSLKLLHGSQEGGERREETRRHNTEKLEEP